MRRKNTFLIFIVFLVFVFMLGSSFFETGKKADINKSSVTANESNKPEVDAVEVSNPVSKTGGQVEEKQESVENWVYLTFDDGPDKASTAKILDILDAYDIKATFFVIGKHIDDDNQDLVVDIDAKGHYVANHTYSHSYLKIYASDQAFVEDVRKNETLLYELIGKKPLVVREPGGRLLGKYDSSLHKLLVKLGYDRMEWDIDSFDSRSPVPTKDVIIANVKAQVLKKEQENNNERLVILLHDTRRHLSTLEALPEIIELLQEKGYGFAIPFQWK